MTKMLPVWWRGDRLTYEDSRIHGDGTVLYDRVGTPEEKERIEKALGIVENDKRKSVQKDS